jgi:hypothetical protein
MPLAKIDIKHADRKDRKSYGKLTVIPGNASTSRSMATVGITGRLEFTGSHGQSN